MGSQRNRLEDPVGDAVTLGPVSEQAGGAAIVEASGELTTRNSAAVHTRLAELLDAHDCVVLDLNGLRLQRTSTLQMLTSALDQAGGWPDARLAVFTADRLIRQALQTSGVANLLWVAHDAGLALARCSVRPSQVRVRWAAPPDVGTPAWLRARIARRCRQWGLSEKVVEDALLVVTELTANVVDHARTSMRVHLQYDGSRLRCSVRDYAPDHPRLQPLDPYAARGRGLQVVNALATRWGWTSHPDGKHVWAVLGAGA
jgi:anti-sigma regulatory factor (Ser/Thr protein kinase)/anti-anti-sigma regulatory factor